MTYSRVGSFARSATTRGVSPVCSVGNPTIRRPVPFRTTYNTSGPRIQGRDRQLSRRDLLVPCNAGDGPTVLLAKAVGWAVVGGSCVRSVPQIVRIWKSNSVQGLSLVSFVSEYAVCAVHLGYNLARRYPFSSYGDVLTCGLQCAIIIALIFQHGGNVSRRKKTLLTAGLLAFTVWIVFNFCGDTILSHLQASTLALLIFGGRLPQIWSNFKNGNSGELSLTTCLLSVAGNIGRLFTTLTLVDDGLVLAGAVIQLILNGIILLQTTRTAIQARRLKLHPAAS